MLGAVHLVVVDLRHRGVELVRACRACTFVLVIDMGGRIEGLLKSTGAEQRGRPPLRVDLPHFFRNVNLALTADLLIRLISLICSRHHSAGHLALLGSSIVLWRKNMASADAGNEITIKNLLTAFEGESNAHAKYMLFAKNAEADGLHGAASL